MQAKTTWMFTWGLSTILSLLFITSLASFLYANFVGGDSAAWELIISAILLSIPLGLLYASIGVIVVAIWQKRHENRVTARLAKLIYWGPRVAGVAIILFVSMFALDVFEEGYSLGEMLLAFFMHMLPSIALMIVLALAWRWEWVGFLAFLGASGLFFALTFVRNDPLQELGMFLVFTGPLLVIAVLFGIYWRWRNELHPTSTKPLAS